MSTTKEITKSLGGDRLGSGNKINVNLHAYNRSTHDLSRAWRSSATVGTLIPFMVEPTLNGDTISIDLEAIVRTMPAVGPLYGSYKLQLDVFAAPMRLYNGLLHNNMQKIGMQMDQVKLPKFHITQTVRNPKAYTIDYNNSQIAPDALIAYLGLRGIGDAWTTTGDTMVSVDRKFNAIPLLAYWDIYKNYYANKQEEKGMYISRKTTGLTPGHFTYATNWIGYPDSTHINFKPVVESTVPTGVTLTGTNYQAIGGNGYLNVVSSINNIIFMADGEIINDSGLQIVWLYNGTYGATNIAGMFPNYVFAEGGILLGSPTAPYDNNHYQIVGIGYNANSLDENAIELKEFPLENIDNARIEILKGTGLGNEVMVNSFPWLPYSEICTTDAQGNNLNKCKMFGLAIKTYQSDILNNWLKTEWIDGTNGISQITAIDTSSGSFTVDALNLAQKVYNMLNRIAVSGGSYEDWQEAVYSTEALRRAETPFYLGGMSSEVIFQEVVSQSATADQPLGSLAGKGTMAAKRGGHIEYRAEEPSFIIGIASLTPRIDYNQGNKWFITELDTMDDLHKPALDGIGFEDLLQERAAWFGTYWDAPNGVWKKLAMGKSPAWINYMTAVNETYGDFCREDQNQFMVLNRNYEWNEDRTTEQDMGIKDATTYIDPTKYNYVFADTQLSAENFWLQIGIKMEARRVMSAKIIPQM